MAFDDLKAELALLINQMENQPEDPHELYLQIREKLNEMRAFGMPLPADLVAFEKDLEAQFAATKRAAKEDGGHALVAHLADDKSEIGRAHD